MDFPRDSEAFAPIEVHDSEAQFAPIEVSDFLLSCQFDWEAHQFVIPPAQFCRHVHVPDGDVSPLHQRKFLSTKKKKKAQLWHLKFCYASNDSIRHELSTCCKERARYLERQPTAPFFGMIANRCRHPLMPSAQLRIVMHVARLN